MSPKSMEELTVSERDRLAAMLAERKQLLRDEIRAGLTAMNEAGYEDFLSNTADVGDQSLATLISNVTNAEVARDAAELQDVIAAETRLTTGTYGQCADCTVPVPYARLAAYPTAKRCLRCQHVREATDAYA